MINIYKNTNMTNQVALEKLDNIEPGAWINVVSPDAHEIHLLSKKLDVPLDFLNAALDDEESSRIEHDGDNLLVVIDIPFSEKEENSLTYDTYPLSIIYTEKNIITVCLKNSKILQDFSKGNVKDFFTYKRSRFILQILYKVASSYLTCLRQIDKKSSLIQRKLQKAMSNRQFMQLLSLRNSLIYFSTSLKSNEITLEKMLKLELLQRYDEDKELLEDVIIENKQAIEMTHIYGDILRGTMDVSAAVISNNLNIVMKFLTTVTIVFTIPTIISGLWGMNVDGIPFGTGSGDFWGFWKVTGIAIFLSLGSVFYMYKKKLF